VDENEPLPVTPGRLRALWLSRHTLSDAQIENFKEQRARIFEFSLSNGWMREESRGSYLAPIDFVSVNITLPPDEEDAALELQELTLRLQADFILAVLPAHIAAYLVDRRTPETEGVYIPLSMPRFGVWVPVNAAAPASEGELRPFKHHHWYRIPC
jgi:hypothetical protein